MPTEPIVISTGSSPFELAPAVLAVLADAPNGLVTRTHDSPLANAICDRFGIERDISRKRGTRLDSVLPDFNIEFAITYLVNVGCIRKDGQRRFITDQGRSLLRKPLAEIQRQARAGKQRGSSTVNDAIFPTKRGRPARHRHTPWQAGNPT